MHLFRNLALLKMVTHRPTTQRNITIRVKDVLCGNSSKYKINKFLGEGNFGKVLHCNKVNTDENIAVKIVTRKWIGMREVSAHEKLKALDTNKNNLAGTTDHFIHDGHVCLAFEMLDLSFYDFMRERYFQPLPLSEIRAITQQLLVALNALKSIHLVHGDIKPDNVMMVNHELQPFKVKLIDFGFAGPVSMLKRGITMQACPYRAPEVMLGLPLSESIDMWSLGCVLAFLYTGQNLFPRENESEVMSVIVQMLGQPTEQMLDSGMHTKEFFSKDKHSPRAPWRLIKDKKGYKFSSLDDLVKAQPQVKNATEYEDTKAFLSLLKRMLHVDPAKRITPSKALGHRFITMKHFDDTSDNQYVESAHSTLENSHLEPSSVEFKHFVTSSEEMNGTLNTNNKGPPTADRNASSDKEATELAEVKTQKKWLNRIGQFFSRIYKSVHCYIGDVFK